MKHVVLMLILIAIGMVPPLKIDEFAQVKKNVCTKACEEVAQKSFIPSSIFVKKCIPICLKRIECTKVTEDIYSCRDKGK